MTKEEILKLRNDGKTYAEIGEMFGVTKQAVHQMIGNNRVRKNNYEIENIKLKGIYEFMRDNPTMSVTAFVRKCNGYPSGAAKRKYYDLFRGAKGVHFSITEILRTIELTGKTFEELFEEREEYYEN